MTQISMYVKMIKGKEQKEILNMTVLKAKNLRKKVDHRAPKKLRSNLQKFNKITLSL